MCRLQVRALENAFHASRFIAATGRDRLARQIGLTATQVKIWFQNRRYKEKKIEKDLRFNFSQRQRESNSNSIAVNDKMRPEVNLKTHIFNSDTDDANKTANAGLEKVKQEKMQHIPHNVPLISSVLPDNNNAVGAEFALYPATLFQGLPSLPPQPYYNGVYNHNYHRYYNYNDVIVQNPSTSSISFPS